MFTLILVRHAITQANEHKQLLGFCESPISEVGKKQIQALAKVLKDYQFDAIYTSPSGRAIETIKGVAEEQSKDIHLSEELRELHFGDFEGKSFQTLHREYPNEITKMIELGADYTYPNGESLRESYLRTARKIDQIRQIHENQTVLIGAHAGTIRNILSHLISKGPELHWHFKIDHASLTLVTIENDFPVIEMLNNTYFIRSML